MKRERPDVADKLRRRGRIQESTIKMTLNKFCTDAQLRSEINDCVRLITRISVEASRFANLWVLQILETDDEVMPKLDQSFFYSIFSTIAGSKKSVGRFAQALLLYEQVRPEGLHILDCRHITQMVNVAAKEYMEASQNHIVLNLSARVSKAFKLFFDSLAQKFLARDRNIVKKYYLKRMSREVGPEGEAPMWASLTRVPTLATRAAVSAYIEGNTL